MFKGILFSKLLEGLILRLLRKGVWLKTTTLSVIFLWLKVFKKLVIDRLFDHVEKFVFSDFQYGYRSS